MPPLVEIRDLTKIYHRAQEEIVGLDHINVNIEDGEFIALMGPSGSGKTTLLNILAGIDHQTSGHLTIDGMDISSLSEAKMTAWRTRNIGYIFQFYNLMPVLTAYENVELPLLLMRLSKTERHDHVMASLEATGIADRKDHLPRQLSGGQEQRVAISRALVADAKILVADEPTGNLDAQSEKEIMELLSRLHREFHKTIVMVTHDASAAAYADRIVRLEKGKMTDGEVAQAAAGAGV